MIQTGLFSPDWTCKDDSTYNECAQNPVTIMQADATAYATATLLAATTCADATVDGVKLCPQGRTTVPAAVTAAPTEKATEAKPYTLVLPDYRIFITLQNKQGLQVMMADQQSAITAKKLLNAFRVKTMLNLPDCLDYKYADDMFFYRAGGIEIRFPNNIPENCRPDAAMLRAKVRKLSKDATDGAVTGAKIAFLKVSGSNGKAKLMEAYIAGAADYTFDKDDEDQVLPTAPIPTADKDRTTKPNKTFRKTVTTTTRTRTTKTAQLVYTRPTRTYTTTTSSSTTTAFERDATTSSTTTVAYKTKDLQDQLDAVEEDIPRSDYSDLSAAELAAILGADKEEKDRLQALKDEALQAEKCVDSYGYTLTDAQCEKQKEEKAVELAEKAAEDAACDATCKAEKAAAAAAAAAKDMAFKEYTACLGTKDPNDSTKYIPVEDCNVFKEAYNLAANVEKTPEELAANADDAYNKPYFLEEAEAAEPATRDAAQDQSNPQDACIDASGVALSEIMCTLIKESKSKLDQAAKAYSDCVRRMEYAGCETEKQNLAAFTQAYVAAQSTVAEAEAAAVAAAAAAAAAAASGDYGAGSNLALILGSSLGSACILIIAVAVVLVCRMKMAPSMAHMHVPVPASYINQGYAHQNQPQMAELDAGGWQGSSTYADVPAGAGTEGLADLDRTAMTNATYQQMALDEDPYAETPAFPTDAGMHSTAYNTLPAAEAEYEC